MEEQQRLEVFKAQTKNVRELERAWSHINRQINALLLSKNETAAEINTKLLSLIYCALAEAVFSKILHTPKGLALTHIEQVKAATSAGGVKSGWLKCLELAMQSVQGAKSNHAHNVQKKFHSLIEEFIFDPSLLRNKLAHGQWAIALNRDNNAINNGITQEIANNTAVDLYRKKFALQKLAAILEDIIESPNKAHHRDYWEHLESFETEQRKMASWTMALKVAQLRAKRTHRPNASTSIE